VQNKEKPKKWKSIIQLQYDNHLNPSLNHSAFDTSISIG